MFNYIVDSLQNITKQVQQINNKLDNKSSRSLGHGLHWNTKINMVKYYSEEKNKLDADIIDISLYRTFLTLQGMERQGKIDCTKVYDFYDKYHASIDYFKLETEMNSKEFKSDTSDKISDTRRM